MKKVNNIVAPAPETEAAAPIETVQTVEVSAAKPSLWEQYAANAKLSVGAEVGAKMEAIATAKQRLAHAADLYGEGKSKNTEASDVANLGAVPLYQGRSTGLLTNAEVSAVLGDVFGYKPKADGTPGKTPKGEGEALRKRINRAVAAYEYAIGTDDGGKFFAGLPTDEVFAVCNEVNNGDCSLFTAYERFADIKKEHTAKTEQAFSVKHIESLCESLGKPEAVAIITGNSELIAAYAALSAMVAAIGEAGAELLAAE